MMLLRREWPAATAAVGHGHDVRPAVERLVEVADVTRDVLVSRDGEGNEGLEGKKKNTVSTESCKGYTSRRKREGGTYDEAECEERPSLEDVRTNIAAMSALADETLVAGEFLAEGLLAADEEEEHGVSRAVLFGEGCRWSGLLFQWCVRVDRAPY